MEAKLKINKEILKLDGDAQLVSMLFVVKTFYIKIDFIHKNIKGIFWYSFKGGYLVNV